MTGWEMSQELARLFVFISLGLMVIGVLLILSSFKKSKRVQLTITQETLRVRDEQWRELAKQKAPQFYQIAETLQEMNDRLHTFAISDIDGDLSSENLEQLQRSIIELANINIERFSLIAKVLNKLGMSITKGFGLVMLIFQVRRAMRKIKGADNKSILGFFLKVGWSMDRYELGLTRKIESDAKYYELNATLKEKRVNAPISINDGIQDYLNYAFGVNSFLRMYKYWIVSNPYNFPSKIQAVLDGLEYMLNVVMQQRLSVFVSRIDNYVLGIKNEL